MSEKALAPLHTWLIEPLELPVAQAIERLRRAPDVQHVAIMPDVHLASDVCVGTVFGTTRLIYPQAVGGDIGCGMLAVAFDASVEAFNDASVAGRVLAAMRTAVPGMRRNRRATITQPQSLKQASLSHPHLESIRMDDGSLQFATLGGGNHFVELQADELDRLWLMIHSGSRGMGYAVRAHHLASAGRVGFRYRSIDSGTDAGQAYLHDMEWARQYAQANRHAMAEQIAAMLHSICGVKANWETLISIDHNHVQLESVDGQPLWIHRKGAMPAHAGLPGLIPGSMGTSSFHVEGRGCAASLSSSAHGAGRTLRRERARQVISDRDLARQMEGVWYDFRASGSLRSDAPGAYKDVTSVLRAQRELTRTLRTLRPVLNYKGR